MCAAHAADAHTAPPAAATTATARLHLSPSSCAPPCSAAARSPPLLLAAHPRRKSSPPASASRAPCAAATCCLLPAASARSGLAGGDGRAGAGVEGAEAQPGHAAVSARGVLTPPVCPQASAGAPHARGDAAVSSKCGQHTHRRQGGRGCYTGQASGGAGALRRHMGQLTVPPATQTAGPDHELTLTARWRPRRRNQARRGAVTAAVLAEEPFPRQN